MIVLRLLGAIFDLLFVPLRLWARARSVRAGAFVHVTVDGQVVDVVAPPRFWQIRRQHAVSLHALARLVDAVVRDERVRGIVLTIKQLSAGMATATSLRAQLVRARAAGKEIVVHLPMGGGTKEVYVATAASKIVVAPATHLSPLGFLSSSRYVRRALDRAGIEPEVFACGEYKSAGETLMRDAMSAPQREQLERLLDGFHDALLDAIAEGRHVDRARAAALVDGAPHSAEAAVAAGLADAIAYEDELPGVLGLGGRKHLVDAGAYLARSERPLVRWIRPRPVIAVIDVHGPIAHAAGPLGTYATDERVAKAARAARMDRRVRGVVLHVDSPGGSALASDRMHHEIAQLARDKPVVACMANVAASGGYYVAAAASEIVAEPTTVTGSIGVVAARVTLDPLLARIGITTEIVRRGARAGLLGATQPIDDDERRALGRELDATYKTFVGIVARGRRMDEAEVEKLARGRVYTGGDAHAVGLVDRLGGFDAALAAVKARLPEKIRERVVVRVARPPRRDVPPLDPPPKQAALVSILDALLPDGYRALVDLAARGERVLALLVSRIPPC